MRDPGHSGQLTSPPKTQGCEWGLMGKCAPQISNQPPPQAERPPSTQSDLRPSRLRLGEAWV
ncbi:hypothetical protein MC885_003692 [Smutsia gigantea]|nr:hypothetical protein MC885_003692 [Smutsia gigantea]